MHLQTPLRTHLADSLSSAAVNANAANGNARASPRRPTQSVPSAPRFRRLGHPWPSVICHWVPPMPARSRAQLIWLFLIGAFDFRMFAADPFAPFLTMSSSVKGRPAYLKHRSGHLGIRMVRWLVHQGLHQVLQFCSPHAAPLALLLRFFRLRPSFLLPFLEPPRVARFGAVRGPPALARLFRFLLGELGIESPPSLPPLWRPERPPLFAGLPELPNLWLQNELLSGQTTRGG